RAGLISPDETTVEYLRGREYVPEGEAFEEKAQEWLALATDEGAEYDKTVTINAKEIEPQVTRGTNPSMCVPVSGSTPSLAEVDQKSDVERALDYMGLEENQPISSIEVDHVFIGSCTNSRITDLQKAASIIEGKKVKSGVRAMVVPGSFGVK